MTPTTARKIRSNRTTTSTPTMSVLIGIPFLQIDSVSLSNALVDNALHPLEVFPPLGRCSLPVQIRCLIHSRDTFSSSRTVQYAVSFVVVFVRTTGGILWGTAVPESHHRLGMFYTFRFTPLSTTNTHRYPVCRGGLVSLYGHTPCDCHLP